MIAIASSGRGRWTFQMNVDSVFDAHSLEPRNLADDGHSVRTLPSGHSVAYQRCSYPAPGELWLSVSCEC